MKKAYILVPVSFAALIIAAIPAYRYVQKTTAQVEGRNGPVHAGQGDNPWNQGTEPKDTWAAIEQMHGHVGPWNVLGWRIGQRALEQFGTRWGRHDLDITVHIPMDTPYSCMADGLVIGTGNSLGRLDIRLAEVGKMEMIIVDVVNKGAQGGRIIYRPKLDYMGKILTAPAEDVHVLSHECFKLANEELFEEERIQ
jgi:formylmethanofuran dehydrogenase subunit E